MSDHASEKNEASNGTSKRTLPPPRFGDLGVMKTYAESVGNFIDLEDA